MGPRKVETKKDFTVRYFQNEFGNRSPTWHSIEEFDPAGKTGLYHLRSRVTASETHYDLTATYAAELWKAQPDPTQFFCSAMCPTEKTLFQGEVMQRVDGGAGLDLYFSTVPKPMRESLRLGGQRAVGLTAKMLLQKYLDTNSYDWLMYLLEAYPGHVVEFTTLSVEWGTVPGYRTLFWEIRNY